MKVLERNMDVKKLRAIIFAMATMFCCAPALAIVDEVSDGNPPLESQESPLSVTKLPIVRTIPLPGTWGEGLAFDGTWVWYADSGTDLLYRINPSDGSIYDSRPSPARHSTGLSWYEGNLTQWHGLWNCDYNGRVYQAVSPLHRIRGPDLSMNGVAWIEDNLWVSCFGSDELHQVDPINGDILGTMPAEGTFIRGMTMWKGDLWVTNSNYAHDAIYRLDPSNGTILGTYLPEGFTHDMFILGVTAVGDELWVVEKYSRQVLVMLPEPATLLLFGLGGLAILRKHKARLVKHLFET